MWKDANGREWSTAINVTTVKRVQELTGELLTDINFITRIDDDIVLLCDVLCAICKPQRDERGITSEQFGELLAGPVIDAAYESFRKDWLDFFPLSRRQLISRVLETTQKIQTEAVRLMEQKLSDQQTMQLVKKSLQEVSQKLDRQLATLGDGSGSAPVPSESTPVP